MAERAARSRSTNVQCRAPGQRLDPERAAPGVEVDDPASTSMSRLFSALNIASRTDRWSVAWPGLGGDQPPPPELAGDDSHRGRLGLTGAVGQLVVMLEPEPVITCVDCGGRAHLLTGRASTKRMRGPTLWQPGDIVTYRCVDCLDRWDIVLADDAETATD